MAWVTTIEKYAHKKMKYEWNNEQCETRRMWKENNIHVDESKAKHLLK